MKTPSLHVLFLLALVACGGEPPPLKQPLPAPAPSDSTARVAAPEAATPDTEPTRRTPEQLARERTFAPLADAILDAFFNADPIQVDGPYADVALTKDGKKVLFRSNRSGVMEVYLGEVANPGAPPTKVAGGSDRIRSAQFTHDARFLLFRRDAGADENFHILRAKPDGSEVQDLTPGEPLRRERPMLPREKPDMMVYSAVSAGAKEAKLFVQSIAGGEPRLVYTDPGASLSADVRPDGKHALLIRWLSPSNQVVIDVDLASGAAKQVYPARDGAAGVEAAMYSADGKRIFVATDEGHADGSSLLALDEATLAPRAKYALAGPGSGTINAVIVSPRGDRVAVSLDLEHHNELRILDARSLTEQRVARAPLGEVTPGNFTVDGKQFTIAQSFPDTPADIYLVNAATGVVTPLRADARPGLAELPALTTTIATVKAFDGRTIPINVYLPKDLPAGERRPVIANFHGGPSNSSFIAWNYRARFYTSLGYAWVEPNIRGSTGFGREYEMADNREKRADAMMDVETVNAWIRAQGWADGARVTILGGSYGGYLVLMALTRQPLLWRAGIDLCGIVNLHTFMDSTDKGVRAILSPEFGDPDSDGELLQAFSPFAQVGEIVRPLFVYQGANDPRVPRSESDQIAATLRARNVPLEYMVAPNEGHSLEQRENRVEFLTRTARFLEENGK